MKRINSLVIFLAIATSLKAQILTPVKWSYAAKKTGNNEAVIFIKSIIDDGWHIYSTKQKDGGPVKTTFTFEKSLDYVLAGKLTEPVAITKFEKTFDMNVFYFEKSVIFQQNIKLRAAQTTIKGKLEFMVCNSEKCLPPEEIEFSIPVK